MEKATGFQPAALAIDGEVAQAVVDAAPDATVIVDEDGTIVFANPHAAELTGYEGEELVGRPVETLVPPQHRDIHRHNRDTYVVNPRTRPMGAALDLYAARKDGRLVPVEISLSPLRHGGRTYTIASVRDMTARPPRSVVECRPPRGRGFG